MPGGRRTVTVVFSDLVGSTELGERLDPETLRDALDRYFDAARTAVERHGGLIEKFIGDAVLAVFGIPTLHEDDAVRGVRAARAMQAALIAVNEELERDFGVRLRTRTGVNTGEVITGDPSAGQRFVTGDAVNVAARLQQAAEPDTILVGEATYRLAIHAGAFERLPGLDLKGKAAPIVAHRLLALTDPEGSPGQRAEAPFVGREEELTAIERELLRADTETSARSITLIGEAGIGKSRLVAEALRSRERSALRGRCLPYGDGITYWPIIQVLRSAGGIGEDDDDAGVRRKLRDATPRALDDLVIACLASVISGSGTFPVEEVSRAFRTFAEALAVVRPIVLLLEDVHWAEPTLLDLVEHLSRAAARLAVLCTARPEFLHERPEWRGSSTLIELKPLHSEETGRLVTELVGADLVGPLKDRLIEAAGGNPFFVEQIVSMLREQGTLGADGGHPTREGASQAITMPPSVAAVLDARIDRLPDPVRSVAERAAVVGKIFYRRAVEVLGDADEDVDPAIAHLVSRGFLEPHATDLPGERAFAFRHILIRDAVYRGTLKRRRAEWHERLGDWLEERAAGLGGAEEIVGYHLEQANRLRVELELKDERTGALAARAGEALAVAGRRASDRGDAPAAAALLKRALALTSDGRVGVRLLADLAIAQLDSGFASEAVASAGSAVEKARTTDDPGLALRARVAGILVDLHAGIVSGTRLIAESEGILERLRPMGDLDAVVDATTAIGILKYSIGQMSAAAERLQEAATLARELGRAAREDRALDWLSIPVAYGPTPVARAREACEGIIRSTRHRSRVEASARTSLAVLQAMSLGIEEARANVTLSRAIYEELGMVLETATVSQALGVVEMLAGDPARAEADLRDDRRVLEERRGGGYLASTDLVLAVVLDALGRFDEAMDIVVRMDPLIPADDLVGRTQLASLKVHALMRERRYEEAEEEARGAVTAGRGSDRYDILPRALVDLADVASSMGRSQQAVDLLEQARTLHVAKENAASLADVDRRLAGLGHPST